VAIIECTECKGKVSTTAKFCPHCGAAPASSEKPSPPGGAVSFTKKDRRDGLFIAAGVIGVFVLLANIFSGGNVSTDNKTASFSSEPKKETFVEQGSQRIETALVCRAAFAASLQRPVSSIEVTDYGTPAQLTFDLEDTEVIALCKTEGNQVLWVPAGAKDWDPSRGGFRITYQRNDSDLLIKVVDLNSKRDFSKTLPIASLRLPATPSTAQDYVRKTEDTKTPSELEISVSDEQVCKAAVAKMFYKDPSIISTSEGRNFVTLTYTRKSDGSEWKYRCKVDGNNISWAGFIDGAWGRWRTGPSDARVTYEVNGKNLSISEKYPGSKASVRSYRVSEL
jgi:hypothetical protein